MAEPIKMQFRTLTQVGPWNMYYIAMWVFPARWTVCLPLLIFPMEHALHGMHMPTRKGALSVRVAKHRILGG